MKLKHKGKVYPSPSSSTSSSSPPSLGCTGDRDVLSVLNLLPAAIFALASALSMDDREVLAYMITRSLKTSTTSAIPSSSFSHHDYSKKKSKPPNKGAAANHMVSPIFDCDCFDCYTSYWFRWDSSSNRHLIHQAIEAFEDHLTTGELYSKKTTRLNRRDKTARRLSEKSNLFAPVLPQSPVPDEVTIVSFASPDDDTSDKAAGGVGEDAVKLNDELTDDMTVEEAAGTQQMVLVVRSPAAAAMNSHKGLVRKVLPDVLGILNSRLWNLWSPNV